MNPRRRLSVWEHIRGLFRHLVEWTATHPVKALSVLGVIFPILGTGGTVIATKAFWSDEAKTDTAAVAVALRIERKVDRFGEKIDTVSMRTDRLRKAVQRLRGGDRAIRDVLEEEDLERRFRGGIPFDPSRGFTAFDLSGRSSLYGGRR